MDLLLVGPVAALQRYAVVKGQLQQPVTIAANVGPYTHVINAGDWNGDGYQDVLVRTPTGKIYLWRGTRTGQLARGVSMGFGANIRAMTSTGDADADGHSDLAVITQAGNLWLYYGNGKSGRASRKLISSGWQDHSWLRAPGDFNGDKRPDLISLVGDHLAAAQGNQERFRRTGNAGHWLVGHLEHYLDRGLRRQSPRGCHRPYQRRPLGALQRQRSRHPGPRCHTPRLLYRHSLRRLIIDLSERG